MSASGTTTADVLLHPVRLRIVQTLLGGRELTTAQIQQDLGDVSAATVYRQVATLLQAGVLEVSGERKIRGVVERSYVLVAERASVSADDARSMSHEQHRAGFLTFVAALVADFDRYLGGDRVDLARDLAGYRQAAFYATDDETARMVDEIRAALAPLVAQQPVPGRRRRLLTTVLLPTGEQISPQTGGDRGSEGDPHGGER
jgi:DNA-binding transcriptional ArsR family regulator